MLTEYLRPMWRWTEPLQNDFAARADWCVKSYAEANHQPVVKCNKKDVTARPGEKIRLSAKGTTDPDGDRLTYRWWHYREAGTYAGSMHFSQSNSVKTTLTVPADAKTGDTIHVILEVTDSGIPALTRYARVVITVK